MIEFLEPFLEGGLVVGYDLPEGFISDVTFEVIGRKIGCNIGQVLVGGSCCKYIFSRYVQSIDRSICNY